MEGSTGNITASGHASLPLDAGSIFVLAVTLLVFCGPLFVLFPPFPPRKSDALAETHNKLGVPASASGLLRDHAAEDGNDNDNANAPVAAAAAAAAAKIRSLFVYPVKSCRGIELRRAKVVPTGLEFDRLFTFAQLRSPFPVRVDEADTDGAKDHAWEFITQRQFPLLATVEVELWRPDLAKIKGFRDVAAGSSGEVFLILRFPWREGGLRGVWELFAAKCMRGWRAEPQMEILLPAEFPEQQEIERKAYTLEKVKVWKDEVTALNMGCELPEELRLYLGVSNKLALFRIDPEGPREVYKCAPASKEAGYQPVVGFQDSVSIAIRSDLMARTQADCATYIPVSRSHHELGQRASFGIQGEEGCRAKGAQPAAV